jgi:hypothetical protein
MVDVFEAFWSHLLPSVPILFAYMAGIVACVVCWWRSPRAASFALAGLIVLLAGHLAGTAVTAWIIHAPQADGADIGPRLLAIGLLRGFVYVAGMALLLVAVFTDRTPRALSDRDF